MRGGGLGVGLALLLLALSPGTVAAHNPAMSLSPGFGPIGTLVTVSVTGFDSDRDADVFWNQEEIGVFHIGPDGSGSLAFSVPADATPNSYQVLVLCMTCQPPLGERADAWFEVVAGESTPTPTGGLPTATATPMPPTITAPATATVTCGQLGNCTATPTLTSLPTATSTSVSAPTLLPSVTPPLSSPTLVATQTSCFTSTNCTATPTRATVTPLPRPSATVSMTPTGERTSTVVPSPSPTRVVEPSQTSLPVPASTTPTTTLPPRASNLSVTTTGISTLAPVTTVRGAESAFVILTILLGGLVLLLGGWLSGLVRWPFRRGR